MRILLVGNGAREHAMAAAVARNAGNELVAFASAKNPGVARLCETYFVGDICDSKTVAAFAANQRVELAMMGPESVLNSGVPDALWAEGIPCYGPVKNAAKLECDKAFCRDLLARHKVRGAPRFGIFDNARDAGSFIDELGEVAIKPSGLTGGKGVKIMGVQLKDASDAKAYATEVLDQKIGKLGSVVVEERLIGEEFTLQAFVDGKHVVPMPAVQDFKLAFEGDTGPNTGGMGSYSDAGDLLPFMRQSDRDEAVSIMASSVEAVHKELGAKYCGTLYGQFMITKDGIKLIEYNARFGDPEAMNVLSVLQSDFSEIMLSATQGKLASAKFEKLATVVKYLVPSGYPENPAKNQPLQVDAEKTASIGAELYYAAVDERDGIIYTSSSRAIAVLGKAPSIAEAEKIAEQACASISGPVFHRRDIATAPLLEKKISRVKALRG